jgi:hypothetical protein
MAVEQWGTRMVEARAGLRRNLGLPPEDEDDDDIPCDLFLDEINQSATQAFASGFRPSLHGWRGDERFEGSPS